MIKYKMHCVAVRYTVDALDRVIVKKEHYLF